MPPKSENQLWMTHVLLAAALYNLLWAALNILKPNFYFDWLGIPRPLYPSIWQGLAMVIGVYGLGYAIAAVNPLRHWPIVLVGLAGKVLGPFGFAYAVIFQGLPSQFGATLLTNDLIWWLPFGLILYRVCEAEAHEDNQNINFDSAVQEVCTADGRTLHEVAVKEPHLIIFLRHFGCIFCRETLTEVARLRRKLEQAGTRITLVHMGTDQQAQTFFAKYELHDVTRISDPECRLYRAFGLGRGRLQQLFGMSALWRGFVAGVLKGNGLGLIIGDSLRMPGIFLMLDKRIIKSYYYKTIADRPMLVDLAKV